MRDTDHYTRLLGISSPCGVSLVELDEPALIVTINLRLDSSAKLRCPQCRAVCPRYDSRRRKWRHVDTMQFTTIVEADWPRVSCSEHGVDMISVPWAEGSSRCTVLEPSKRPPAHSRDASWSYGGNASWIGWMDGMPSERWRPSHSSEQSSSFSQD